MVHPHLIVHARICKLGRILAIRPWFDEFFCLFWDGEIQTMHAVVRCMINNETGEPGRCVGLPAPIYVGEQV